MKRLLMILIPAVFPGHSVAQPPQPEMKSWNPRIQEVIVNGLAFKKLKLTSTKRKFAQEGACLTEEITGILTRVDTVPGGIPCQAFCSRTGDVETYQVIVTSNTCSTICRNSASTRDINKSLRRQSIIEPSSPKGTACAHRPAIYYSESKEVFSAIRQACEDHERKQLSLTEKKG
ncbi:hypothetical protein JST99_00460 [Candidatus Dependentiae bacterium]|nr:hypothetical protein [Candidatus Dependentiae bacterium]MCC7415137.1 hypothetical protein [Campylobacterota bacterium]